MCGLWTTCCRVCNEIRSLWHKINHLCYVLKWTVYIKSTKIRTQYYRADIKKQVASKASLRLEVLGENLSLVSFNFRWLPEFFILWLQHSNFSLPDHTAFYSFMWNILLPPSYKDTGGSHYIWDPPNNPV